MPRESAIWSRVRNWLRHAGHWCMKLVGSVNTMRGVPDVLVLVKVPHQQWAVPLFIELKQPGKKPTRLQLKRHDELRKAGACVIVATTLDYVRDVVGDLQSNELTPWE